MEVRSIFSEPAPRNPARRLVPEGCVPEKVKCTRAGGGTPFGGEPNNLTRFNSFRKKRLALRAGFEPAACRSTVNGVKNPCFLSLVAHKQVITIFVLLAVCNISHTQAPGEKITFATKTQPEVGARAGENPFCKRVRILQGSLLLRKPSATLSHPCRKGPCPDMLRC